MQHIPAKLRPAQAEVHKTAHDQDLIEVPKRARLDRETEGNAYQIGVTLIRPAPLNDL